MDRKRIARDVRRHPQHWIAQRRFWAAPIRIGGLDRYPCVGV
jgi:hypothetical protein